MNTFGKNFRVTSFGESHGTALGAVIDGCPAGLKLKLTDIQKELDRRKPGQSKITTPRKEKDQAEILSGIFEDKTLGTPIAIIVRNKDAKSKDYKKLKNIFRPGHADQIWEEKYGHRDYRGGGRSSGRETIGRVIGGAIAKKLLGKTKIIAHTEVVGNIFAEKFNIKEIEKNPLRCADKNKAKEMMEAIKQAQKEKDSLGGIVRIEIINPPKYLGEPVFEKLQARLAEALLSIGAVRSFEFGSGLCVADMKGSEQNLEKEGISGGISTGNNISIAIAVKPTPSIAQKQQALNNKGKKVDIEIKGRHDPVIIPRLIPVAEAMCAMVLADLLLEPPSFVSQLK